MSEQPEPEPPCAAYSSGTEKWWQSVRLFSQDVGLPPFLEAGDRRWMDADRLRRSLAACSWLEYKPAPLFVPYISGPLRHHGRQINKEQFNWRLHLDVAHFLPAEISVSIKEGFLVVGGKHEERPDEHGFTARCFTRKYRLPAETDAAKVVCTLSVDGFLSVEAPLPETSVPADLIIPINVVETVDQVEEEKEESPDPQPDSSSDQQPSAPTAPEVTEGAAPGEESAADVHSEQVQTDSTTAEPQQHDERREPVEEDTQEKPAEELDPSEPESPDTVTIQQLEHKEPAVDEEMKVLADSGVAAEETTQHEETQQGKSPLSEVQEQQLQAPEVEQAHTE